MLYQTLSHTLKLAPHESPSSQPLTKNPQQLCYFLCQTLTKDPQQVWQTLNNFDYPLFFDIIRRMPRKRSSFAASFRHGSLLTTKHHLSSGLSAWLIAHNQAPPFLQASDMAHCSQPSTTFPPGFRHGSLPTTKHHLASRLPAWLIAHKHAPPCLFSSSSPSNSSGGNGL